MLSIADTLRSEALSASSAASHAGLSQNDIAIAVGTSQSQVSRILSGKALRRSRSFDKICIYAYESLNKAQGKSKPSAAANQDLMTALDAVWDGSDQHAKALAAVIRSLGGLGLAKAPIAQARNAKSPSTQKAAQ